MANIKLLEKQQSAPSSADALTHNYRRRRRKVFGRKDLFSLRILPLSLHASCFIFLLYASIWLVGAYSFLPFVGGGGRHQRTSPIHWSSSSTTTSSSTRREQPQPHHYQSSSSLLSLSKSTATTSSAARFTLPPLHMSRRAGHFEESAGDEDEWRAMLAAFQMYKAAYGNLKVPLRFTVPALAPWPEKAWGLKLGQRVAAIRSTGKYVHDENRRKVLDDMGFVWRLRAAPTTKDDAKGLSFDQLYTALVTYREHVQGGKGPISIPNNFVVPDCDPWPQNVRGLPLGKKATSLRSKAFLSANPGAKEKLRAIGFPLDGKVAANDARFQLVLGALQRYKDIYGDLLVPQPFTVPENSKEWPEPTWGLRLGARVNAIRSQGTFVNSHPDRREMLDDIGFVWVPSKSEGGNRRGRRRKEEMEEIEAKTKALEEQSKQGGKEDEAPDDNSFESLFGDAFDFDTDSVAGLGGEGESDSPKWGLEGGRRFEDAARQAEEEAQAVEEYKPPANLADSLALAAERAQEIGIIEQMDERKRIKKGKRPKTIPWFNDDFGGEFVFDDVVEALTVYKKIHGDFSNLTDGSFIVPSRSDDLGDLDSPFDMLGNEGSTSRARAAMANFEDQGDFPMSPDGDLYDFDDFEREEVVAGATSLVSSPDDWPEHLGGMVLGSIVERIRDGSLEVKHLPERKAKLDELEFDWGNEEYFIDIPFEKAVCGMYAYYLVRGDMLVYRDFKIPDEDPWPQALAGYEVGEAVHRIRELQNSFEAYHPEKVSLLRMIDFAWFPSMAIKIDPDEPELTPELQKLMAYGHPAVAFMPYAPMGWAEKCLAEGPFHTPKHKYDQWREYYSWELLKDYWYEWGSRDFAYFMRQKGYPMCADEHEAQYGQGLFTHINETLAVLEENKVGLLTGQDCLTLKDKIEFYLQELVGCTDIKEKERDKLVNDLEKHLKEITKRAEGLSGSAMESSGDDEEYEYEYEYVEEEEDGEEGEWEYEEIDIEDELGLTTDTPSS